MVPVCGQSPVLLQRRHLEAPPRGAVASVSPLLRFTPVSGWHCLFKGKFQRKQIKSE